MHDERHGTSRPRFVWANLILVLVLGALMAALLLPQPWQEGIPAPKAVSPKAPGAGAPAAPARPPQPAAPGR